MVVDCSSQRMLRLFSCSVVGMLHSRSKIEWVSCLLVRVQMEGSAEEEGSLRCNYSPGQTILCNALLQGV